jgi:UTP--glucose-1-phosphate uridylyltransferase
MECLGQSDVNPMPPQYTPLGLPIGEVSWQMKIARIPPRHPFEESMHKPVRKAVFPVAGLGTRFLPATKAMPKEMLPVVDKPLIHYAVEEAKAAGIEQFFFVTSRAKSAIEDHFDRAFELEATLRERGKSDLAAELQTDLPAPGQIAYTRQQTPLGLGHAVWCARALVGDEPFAVLLADDLMIGEPPCLKEMVEAYAETGGNMVAVMEIPREQTRRYGVLDVVADTGKLVRAKGVVEKPEPAIAPSTLMIIGRYIIQPEIFTYLGEMKPGAGGEIQLTDGLDRLIADGQLFHGLRAAARRYDCGEKLGFLEATIALGLQHHDLGPELRKILSSFL